MPGKTELITKALSETSPSRTIATQTEKNSWSQLNKKEKTTVVAKILLAAIIISALAFATFFFVMFTIGAFAYGAVIWQKVALLGITAVLGGMTLASPFFAYHYKMHRFAEGENLKNVGKFLKVTIVNTLKALAIVLLVASVFGIAYELHMIATNGITTTNTHNVYIHLPAGF